MMRFIRPRLRKPLLRGIAGMGLAGAWAIGGGHSRWLAIVIAIAAVGHAVAWYVWAGHDDDDGALLGSRADERQQLVGQKARALAGAVAIAAAYTGLVITLAVKRADAWPFAVMLAVTGFAYIFGLSSYGSGEPDPADDADTEHEARFPANC
jgi:predicted membrane channel-forming protein YqfA (hemolysin III family)